MLYRNLYNMRRKKKIKYFSFVFFPPRKAELELTSGQTVNTEHYDQSNKRRRTQRIRTRFDRRVFRRSRTRWVYLYEYISGRPHNMIFFRRAGSKRVRVCVDISDYNVNNRNWLLSDYTILYSTKLEKNKTFNTWQ